jgi:T-complex protein 1 subunit beta
MLDEAERSLHDALSVLSQTIKETRTVLGGGCAEMQMSCAVEEEARNVQGKKALSVESFAKALRQIPTILADNAGLDSSDLVAQLRAAHFSGKQDAGLSTSPLYLASFRGAFC